MEHEQKLPPGWSKGFSNSQKRWYYSHAETKHTQWHYPTASEARDPAKAKKILAGFLKTEALIALRLAFDLLDFVRLLISSFKCQRVFF